MTAPTIRAIPNISNEVPEATARVLRALKENVETIYGLRGGQANIAELLGIETTVANSGGASGIGGSIAENQIAIGAVTADEIEGLAEFTYDASTITFGSNAVKLIGSVATGLRAQSNTIGAHTFELLDSTGDVEGAVFASGDNIYLLAGNSETVLRGDANGNLRLYFNNIEKFYTTTNGVAIASGQRFNLDGLVGTGDTYIWESSANTMSLVAGGAVCQSMTTAGTVAQRQMWAGETALVDGVNIAWNLRDAQAATVTLAGNRTLDNPTNQQAGASYTLRIVQDATGTRTLAYGTAYKFPGGTAPVLSTGAGDVDLLCCVSDGTNMLCVLNNDFS